METNDTNGITEQPETSQPEINPEDELNHSDKMMGVFSEPSATFEKIAKFPPRTMDWLLPVIVFLIVAIASSFLIMQNPEIKLQLGEMLDKRMDKVEKQMEEKVKSGDMTEADKEKAMEQARKGMEFMTGPTMRSVTVVVWTFIGFFVMVLIYFLLAKFALKGDGTFSGTMVARGLPFYILVVQVIVVAILSIVMQKLLIDSSLASFLGTERDTMAGYLLSRIDPFAIWFYAVVGVGLAKMFKSDSVTKYVVMVFAVWIIGDLLLYLLGMSFGG